MSIYKFTEVITATLIVAIFLSCKAEDSYSSIAIPVEIKNGHIVSEYQFSDRLSGTIALESGFPKIVIDARFASELLEKNKQLKKEDSDASIFTWGDEEPLSVDYILAGGFEIFGKTIDTDILVVDLEDHYSWKNYDVIFPIKYFDSQVGFNLKDNLMTVGNDLIKDENDYQILDVFQDENVNGLAIESTFYVSDSTGYTESISGNFLFDLGGANALYLNLNQSNVKEFVQNFQSIVLDPSKYASNSSIDMKVLAPDKIRIEGFEVQNDYIVAIAIKKYGNADKYTGMIGIDFLKRYEFIFDFHRGRVYMK